MFRYVDVSHDRTALVRSGLRDTLLAETAALGFDHAGWIATVTDTAGGVSFPSMLTSVHVACDGLSVASLVRTSAFDDITLATLFEDGHVVETGLRPKKGWWYLRWGLDVPPQHAFALAYVAADSLAALRDLHQRRIATAQLSGRRPVRGHDLRTYLAIRKRYREVADPRMQRQQLIAVVIGVLALVGTATTQVVPIAGGVLLAFFACLLSLFFVAPVLARGAKAPPPRDARELLRLADDVRQGFLAN